jgi:UDP-GlcNAc:undecaprenyl-phosphate GlcNAc-1-phosphate transferase
MIAAVLFVAGGVTSALLWTAFEADMRSAPALIRQNYRGHSVPVAGGVVLVLAVVVVAAVVAAVTRVGGVTADEAVRTATILGGSVLGFAFIGLFDDLAGSVHAKGFRGHLGALLHGRMTSGLVKLVWGVMLGFLAVPGPLWESVCSGLLIAATANLANLFDRAPGRVIKVSLVGGAVLAAIGLSAGDAAGPFLVLGAGAGLLVPDLRERCMLGDTGANVVGAAVGYGLVLGLDGGAQWVALAVVVAANLVSEVVSFSKVIDRVGPLRWCDRLGALPVRSSSSGAE